jgi:MFS family permease
MIFALASMDVGALLRVPPTPRAPRQIRAGFVYLWTHRDLRASLVLVAIVGVFGQNFRVVLPLLAQDTYHGGAQSYGYLTSALGLGAVIGALGSAARNRSTLWGLLLTCLAFGVTNLLVVVMPSFVLALAVIVTVGITNIVFNTVARTLLIVASDPAMRGRVMALYNIVFLGSTPIGGPVVGWACQAWGARSGFVVAGLTAAGAAAVMVVTSRASAPWRRGNATPPDR